MMMGCGKSVDFLDEPNGCFSFGRMNNLIQWLVFILGPDPLLVPLLDEDVGEVMQRLLV